MSYKYSLFYRNRNDNRKHLYEEGVPVAGAEQRFVLSKIETSEVLYKFNLEELCLIAKIVDLSELKRQIKLTDEQIETHVRNDVEKRIKMKNGAFALFSNSLYGDVDDSVEDQIKKGTIYYKEKRNQLRQMMEDISAESVSNVQFGLESIK